MSQFYPISYSNDEVELMSTTVVCGLHRSGTTFVGGIIRIAGSKVVHEPLNERFGMVGVPIAYPFVERAGESYADMLNDAVCFGRPWNKDVRYIKSKGLHRIVYALTGGRSGLAWSWIRLRNWLGLPYRRVCLKDPFMSLATPYLTEQHALRVVCMVRHPAAIHHSTEKRNWQFDVQNLLRQPGLISKYGSDIQQTHWDMAVENRAAGIALLWKLMVRVNYSLAQRTDLVLLVNHEDLCREPLDWAEMICAHLQVPFTDKVKKYVTEFTGGNRIESQDGRTHDFIRNSRELPDVWRGRVTAKDEQMIVDIAGEEILQVYGSL